MNAFNRVITILVLILAWAAVVLVAAIPETALSWVQQGLLWLEQSLATLAGFNPSWLYPLLRAATIVLSTIIAAGLLWLELRRDKTPAVKVSLQSGGEAAVTTESVARRLSWHVDQLADVIRSTPNVRARGNSVDIQLDLETAPDVDVPMKTEEVMAVTREVIEDQMGLQLNRLKVNIHHAPFPESKFE
ncbi:MAG: hypothetical protein U9R25_01325 [Chloroflexota bacterium]|nr:hypothetical protein [Chloroflexota bacterium]